MENKIISSIKEKTFNKLAKVQQKKILKDYIKLMYIGISLSMPFILIAAFLISSLICFDVNYKNPTDTFVGVTFTVALILICIVIIITSAGKKTNQSKNIIVERFYHGKESLISKTIMIILSLVCSTIGVTLIVLPICLSYALFPLIVFSCFGVLEIIPSILLFIMLFKKSQATN